MQGSAQRSGLEPFKSFFKSAQSTLISMQKITHFLSNQSKSWCKSFPAPALLKPTPHKDFCRFFFYPLSAKINTSPQAMLKEDSEDDGQPAISMLKLPGKLLVKSSNPAYEPFEIDLNDDSQNVAIIGRVEWYGRTVN